MNAYVQPMGQPTPGAAKVGNLYADLQSRTLWLGVDLAVDPTGSVLISDMLAMMEAIADIGASSNAYTDYVLANGGPEGTGYALLDSPIFTGNPRAPTPLTNDNDDSLATTAFVKAAILASLAGKLNIGSVMMYSGLLTDIGVGIWSDWRLCDGGGGTPDLRNKFVMGAGIVAPLAKNPLAKASTDESPSAGSHTHTVSDVALTTAQLPKHTHPAGTLGGVLTGSSGLGGTHAHIITCTSVELSSSSTFRPHLVRAGNSVNAATDTEPNHNHPAGYVVDVTTGATGEAGSAGTHTHTTQNTGAHVHSISSAQLRDAIPYVALAFIMKVA